MSSIVFIVGNSRSGTTMLGRILGRSRAIHTFGELHFFEHQIDSATIIQRPAWSQDRGIALLERLLTSSRDGFFSKIQISKYRAEAEEILAQTEHRDPLSLYEVFLYFETQQRHKRIPCEQTPRYLFFVEDILRVFPDARIINVIRDPRDVLISQKNKWRRRFLGAKNIPLREALRAWSNYHSYLISRLWVSCVRQGARFKTDERVITVKFENLLENPDLCIKNLSKFIGLDYEPEMLNVPQIGSSAGLDEPSKLGINKSRASGWKSGGLSESELKMCEWVAGETMRVNGYHLSGSGDFSLRLIPNFLYLILKLFIVIPMNLSRTKNIRETVSRRLFPGK